MQTSAKYLPTSKSNKKIYLLVLILLSIYTLENSIITNYIDRSILTNIIIPLLWLCVGFFIWKTRHIKSSVKLKHKKSINFWAFYMGVFFILINIFAGFIDGIGRSPYSHSPMGIVTNVIIIGTVLVGREFIRSYLVNSNTKKDNLVVFMFMAMLMTLTSFSFNRYTGLNSLEEIVQFLAQYFLPEFSKNVFASYLVFLGGPLTSIIYLGILEGFHWLSPLLPDLKWITTAFIGILTPIFFMVILNVIHLSQSKQIKKREQDSESPLSWIITSIVSIMLIWFALGVFPIYPSVIATGSMEPMINSGDVVLVEKIRDMDGIYELREGDVIQFSRGNILITHRIIELIEDDDGVGFRTKGDNNSGPDSEIVRVEDIKGTIEYTVPKIGWPTLFIRSNEDVDLSEIEF